MLFIVLLMTVAGYVLIYAGIKNVSVKSVLLRSVNKNVPQTRIAN